MIKKMNSKKLFMKFRIFFVKKNYTSQVNGKKISILKHCQTDFFVARNCYFLDTSLVFFCICQLKPKREMDISVHTRQHLLVHPNTWKCYPRLFKTNKIWCYVRKPNKKQQKTGQIASPILNLFHVFACTYDTLNINY